MLNDAQFAELHNRLKTQGGFSADATTGKSPQVGYMVSIPGAEMQVRSENVAPAHISEFVQKHAGELSRAGAHVGGWDDKETGEVSLDVSRNITPKSSVAKQHGDDVADADARTTASDLAIAGNQKAAYDIKRDKDIPNPGFDPSRRR